MRLVRAPTVGSSSGISGKPSDAVHCEPAIESSATTLCNLTLPEPPPALPEALLNPDMLPSELRRIFAAHEEQIVRMVLSARQEPEARDALQRDLRLTLGLRPDAPVNLTFRLTNLNAEAPRRTFRDLQVTGSFEIVSGAQRIIGGSLQVSGSPQMEVGVDEGSPYLGNPPPAAVLALFREEIPEFRRREVEELRERFRLGRVHLPSGRYASVAGLLEDPGLLHLTAVTRILERFSRDDHAGSQFRLQRLTGSARPNESQQVEIATLVSRMLVADRLSPSVSNVRGCLQSLWEIRNEALGVDLFRGRSIVVGAANEQLVDFLQRQGTSPSDAGLVARLHGGAQVHGNRRMIERLAEEAGRPVTLIRARSGVLEQTDSVLRLHSAHLRSLATAPERRNGAERDEVAALSADVREALGIASHENIRMTFRADQDGGTGTFRVFRGDAEVPFFAAEVQLRKGHGQRVTSIGDYNPPAGAGAVSAENARQQLLEAIRRTPPGDSGFCFLFSGHGLPGAFYLNGDAQGGSVEITPRDLAGAIIDRHNRFGESARNDVYMLLTCHSHEFMREVNRLLEQTNVSVYLYSPTEYGQVSLSRFQGEISGPDFHAILERSQELRNRGQGFTLGSLINMLMQRNGANAPNPSLFAPHRRRGQSQRRFYQISGDPFRVEGEIA